MTDRSPTDHGPYVEAVAEALAAAGVPVEDTWYGTHRRTGGRAAEIGIDRLGLPVDEEKLKDLSDWQFHTTLELSLEWAEERGWTLHDHHLHGHKRDGIGLGIVPAPGAVAERVAALTAGGSIHDLGHPEARGGSYEVDVDVEARLAAYPAAAAPGMRVER